MKYRWLIFLAVFLFATDATAEYRPPRTGNQYFTLGLNFSPGFMADDSAPGDPYDELSPSQGMMASLGLQHAVFATVFMSVELELGAQWFDYHTANPSGRADTETVFAWGAGVLARWVPMEEGFSAGFGITYYRAALSESSLQQAGPDLRLGWYLWQGEEFGLFEVGYVIPMVQGISLPSNIQGDDTPTVASQDWWFHRFRVGFLWGF